MSLEYNEYRIVANVSETSNFFVCDYNFLIIKLNAPSDFACILGFLHELFPVASADFFSSEKCNVTLETINYRLIELNIFYCIYTYKWIG